MVRFAGAEIDFLSDTDCDCFRLAHRALCARAIFRREAADTIRFGWAVLLDTGDDPFKDSIPEIIWSNLSISICAWLRFSRSSRSALSKFDIVYPLGYFDAAQLYRTRVTCGSGRWFWGEVWAVRIVNRLSTAQGGSMSVMAMLRQLELEHDPH